MPVAWSLIANQPNHPLNIYAVKFKQYCLELGSCQKGREFLHFLGCLANPANHPPMSDPQKAAHLSGRADVVSLITGLSVPKSPDGMLLFPPMQPTNTEQT